MLTPQQFGHDLGGECDWSLPIIESIVYHLNSSVDASYTIPSGTKRLLITPQPGVPVFISYSDIAASLPVAGANATFVAKEIVMPTNIAIDVNEPTLHLLAAGAPALVTIEVFGKS